MTEDGREVALSELGDVPTYEHPKTEGWEDHFDPEGDLETTVQAGVPDKTVVHFFWDNGGLFCAFVATQTYMWMPSIDHYDQVKGMLDQSGIPYWERPGNVPRGLYGREIYRVNDNTYSMISNTWMQYSEMLTWTNKHVGQDIPAQLSDRFGKVDAKLDAVTRSQTPIYRLVGDTSTGAIYAYAPGVFFHIKDPGHWNRLYALGLVGDGHAVTQLDSEGVAQVRKEMMRGPDDIEDVYHPDPKTEPAPAVQWSGE